MRLAVRIAAATTLVLGTVAALQTPSYAGDTPGTYTNYSFSGSPGFSGVDYTITPELDPGFGSNVFWSNQFGFTQGNGAYTGLQSNGGSERLFLFSVWDATEAKAGTSGSYCLDFGGEGVGKSCRMRHNWTAGHTYRFRVAHEGERWFGVTVTDLSGGGSFKLGSIRAGSDRLSPNGMVNWAEYFEWSNPDSSCHDQPYSRARFGLPVGDGGVRAAISGTSVSSGCAAFSTVTRVSGGSVQTNGIGNSVRGTIKGLGGKCVVPSAGRAVLGTCAETRDTTWVLARDDTIRMAYGRCLTASGTGDLAKVAVSDCTGAAAQKWTVDAGRLRNTAAGRCLDVADSNASDGVQLIVYGCHGGANQRWTVPAKP
ncbi:DUF3472 domain-containing protein [Nonomuraea sp. NN258]|uniref:ricin-type beta-trefoil lectin domain protein n=1 Tax=Nonomuraea antri TaxID=2730852 RepID=UPI001568A881|nr:ricin-type beta-trefoil lectin domain protein [Nonomuraea antri]NRQ36434.1 DUF3472 domain-containing protein [Nonomuraea antri]